MAFQQNTQASIKSCYHEARSLASVSLVSAVVTSGFKKTKELQPNEASKCRVQKSKSFSAISIAESVELPPTGHVRECRLKAHWIVQVFSVIQSVYDGALIDYQSFYGSILFHCSNKIIYFILAGCHYFLLYRLEGCPMNASKDFNFYLAFIIREIHIN